MQDSAAVPMTRLDTLKIEAERIDIMKIDIEGSEPLFMEGAGEFLRRFRPKIYSELHPTKLERVSKRSREDYLNQMEGLGYRVRTLEKDGSTKPLDRAALGDGSRLLDVVFEPEL
jgi:hypothetical protein